MEPFDVPGPPLYEKVLVGVIICGAVGLGVLIPLALGCGACS